MKSSYVLAAVVGSTIALAWTFQGQRNDRTESPLIAVDGADHSPSTPPSQDTTRLHEELARMKDQLAKLEKRDTVLPTTTSGPQRATNLQESSSSTRDATGANTNDDQAQERERIQQMISHLDVAIQSEPLDSGWAAQVQTGLTDAFKGDDWLGNELAYTDCRVTLCRVEVAHKDANVAGAYVARIGTLAAFANTQGFYQQVTRADGALATVVYVARQGYRLPPMKSP